MKVWAQYHGMNYTYKIIQDDDWFRVSIYEGYEVYDEYNDHSWNEVDAVITTFLMCIEDDLKLRFKLK